MDQMSSLLRSTARLPLLQSQSGVRLPSAWRLGADHLGGLDVDQCLVEKPNHLSNEIEIRAVMERVKQRGRVKLVLGYRSFLWSCLFTGHVEVAPVTL